MRSWLEGAGRATLPGLRPVFVLALALLSACSLFTSLGDLDEEVGGDGDASPPEGGANTGTDASSDADPGGDTGGPIIPGADAAVDADADAERPNLHPNGAMEFSCQGWYPYNATLAADPTAHGGSASCRVCATKTAQDTATFDELGAVVDPVKGGVYVASAWFRVPPDSPPPPSGISLYLGTRDVNDAVVEGLYTSPMAIDLTWKKISVQLTVTKDAKKLRIYGGGTAQLGTCFLVDDVRLERWQ